MIVWAIDVDDICEGYNRPVEEHKRIGQYTFIVLLVIVDHLKYSLSCECFSEFQLY